MRGIGAQKIYVVPCGMINRSLPMTGADTDRQVEAVDGFLAEYGRLLVEG